MTDQPETPDTIEERAQAYTLAKKRAGELGYASVNDALDALEAAKDDR